MKNGRKRVNIAPITQRPTVMICCEQSYQCRPSCGVTTTCCRDNCRRYRRRRYQADRSLRIGVWVWTAPCRPSYGTESSVTVSCSKAVHKENKKTKLCSKEGTGISACSFPACRDGYKCLYVFVKWHF